MSGSIFDMHTEAGAVSVARLQEILQTAQALGAEYVTLQVCLPVNRRRLSILDGHAIAAETCLDAWFLDANYPGRLVLVGQYASDDDVARFAALDAIDKAARKPGNA